MHLVNSSSNTADFPASGESFRDVSESPLNTSHAPLPDEAPDQRDKPDVRVSDLKLSPNEEGRLVKEIIERYMAEESEKRFSLTWNQKMAYAVFGTPLVGIGMNVMHQFMQLSTPSYVGVGAGGLIMLLGLAYWGAAVFSREA